MAARKRIDPPSTSADGWQPLDRVEQQDPDRVYVFANPNDPETGVDSYRNDGYVIERKRADGPSLFGCADVAEGEVLTRRGQYLMSAPRTVKVDKDREVWSTAKAFDQRTLKTGNLDPMRGMGGRAALDGDGIDTRQEFEIERAPRSPGV
jgi:hypothetical protein